MNKQKKHVKHIAIVVIILLTVCCVLTACDRSFEDKYAKYEGYFCLTGIMADGVHYSNDNQADYSKDEMAEFVTAINKMEETYGDIISFYEARIDNNSLGIYQPESSFVNEPVVFDTKLNIKSFVDNEALNLQDASGNDKLLEYFKSAEKVYFFHVGKAILTITFSDKYRLDYEEMPTEADRLNVLRLPGREYSDGNNINTEGNEQEQPEEQFAGYTLNRFYVKVQGLPDVELDPNNLSSTDQTLYQSVLNMYGKTLEMSDKGIKFASTSIFAAYNTAAYTKIGNDITFTNADLAEVASGATDGNKFNLKIVGYVFEYVKN